MNDDELGGDIGDVYYCSWEQTADGKYIGWEKKHPFLRVEVATKNELLPKLGDVVGEHYSDFEAAIEFDPPLETGEGNDELFTDHLIEIGWNSHFTFRPSREIAFAGGRCKRCGGGIGPRTAGPLVVDDWDDRTDGAFSAPSNEPPPCHGNPGQLMIVSEGFLRLLRTAERAQFEARPVEWEPKRRKRFFELIPKAFIPEVAIKGRELGGWRCPECGRRSFSHAKTLGWCVSVVCRTDLPSALPFFFVGDRTDVRLYTSRERWKQLCGKPGTRKLSSFQLAVIDERDAERQPCLPTLDELDEFRRQQNAERWATSPWNTP